MKIVDLTQHYLEFLKDNDLPKYESSNKELFKHYFKYWGNKDSFTPILSEIEVKRSKNLILSSLDNIQKSFENCDLDISELEIILMVGQKHTNGHSAKIKNKFVVFIPIEEYESKAQILTFIPHEIVHGLHYKTNPSFYFNNVEEKEHLGRLLITEGLATYVSMKVMKLKKEESLWAGYKSNEEISNWLKIYQKNREYLRKIALGNFDSHKNSLMFYTAEKGAVGKDREGYLLGLEIVEDIVKDTNASIDKLLSLGRGEFEDMVKSKLK